MWIFAPAAVAAWYHALQIEPITDSKQRPLIRLEFRPIHRRKVTIPVKASVGQYREQRYPQ